MKLLQPLTFVPVIGSYNPLRFAWYSLIVYLLLLNHYTRHQVWSMSTDDGLVWEPKSNFPGNKGGGDFGRHHPITFANTTHGFLLSGSSFTKLYNSDFWTYEASTDTWMDLTNTQAAFPGVPRSFGYGVASAIDCSNTNKAYLGLGVTNQNIYLKDWYEFDMLDSTWKKLANFPGKGRKRPVVNYIESLQQIHVGLGNGGGQSGGTKYKDWWLYDIVTNTWRRLANFPSRKRGYSYHFRIGTDSYVGLGHSIGLVERDWHRFDAVNEIWYKESNFSSYSLDDNNTIVTTEARLAGTQFSITANSCSSTTNNKKTLGFILSGYGASYQSMSTGEFHVYNPQNNQQHWYSLPPHPGKSRWAPGSFVLQGSTKVYMVGGYGRKSKKFYKDLWTIDLQPLFDDDGSSKSVSTTSPSISPNCLPITINIQTDGYGSETSCDIRDSETNAILWSQSDFTSNTVYTLNPCIVTANCLVFNFYDSWGDGMFAYYKVLFNEDIVVAEGGTQRNSGKFSVETSDVFGPYCPTVSPSVSVFPTPSPPTTPSTMRPTHTSITLDVPSTSPTLIPTLRFTAEPSSSSFSPTLTPTETPLIVTPTFTPTTSPSSEPSTTPTMQLIQEHTTFCNDDPTYEFTRQGNIRNCDSLKKVEKLRFWCNYEEVKERCKKSCGNCHEVKRKANSKRGISFHTAQSCNILDKHESVSWWYTWRTTAGFTNSYCNDAEAAYNHATNDLHKEFVPMFSRAVPSRPLDNETVTVLRDASYLMTFNEPELEKQANISPKEAALLWPKIVDIAKEYDLKLVGPCGTIDKGKVWNIEFLRECSVLYGAPCEYDFACLHAYFQPYPCKGVELNRACIGPDGSYAMEKIDGWYNEFKKPIWLTEFACYPWEGLHCNASLHKQLMQQMVPLLDESDKIFRYAWFSMDTAWFDHANTNEMIWDVTLKSNCRNKKFLAKFGDKEQQIQTKYDCVTMADEDSDCYSPLVLITSPKSCYCAKDACENPISTRWEMHIRREVSVRDNNALTVLGQLYQDIGNTSENWDYI